jgi:hypothetical protein
MEMFLLLKIVRHVPCFPHFAVLRILRRGKTSTKNLQHTPDWALMAQILAHGPDRDPAGPDRDPAG